MTPATAPPPAAPPDDPVGRALADPAVLAGLRDHALAVLTRWLADKPRAARADEADEVVQKVCATALGKRADYAPDAAGVAGWLHGILARSLHSHARAVRRTVTADPAAWDRLAADLAPPVADARLDLPVYLARLAPDQRAILDLRYRDGLDGDALAARLGISPGAARVRLCRALDAARTAAGATPAEDRP